LPKFCLTIVISILTTLFWRAVQKEHFEQSSQREK
jgi:hypothetical protein